MNEEKETQKPRSTNASKKRTFTSREGERVKKEGIHARRMYPYSEGWSWEKCTLSELATSVKCKRDCDTTSVYGTEVFNKRFFVALVQNQVFLVQLYILEDRGYGLRGTKHKEQEYNVDLLLAYVVH